MSDLIDSSPQCSREDCSACSSVTLLLKASEKDLGGFAVRRLMPSQELKSVGPFIFFDHLGPATFAPGEGIDVRPHPHIGLATVTYPFEGRLMHRDSLGCVQEIRPQEINWMTAGRGIVHSERTPDTARATGHVMHALQLWVALPEEEQETEPAFYHYASDQLPVVEQDGARVRVMIGSAYGATAGVETLSPTLFLDVQLPLGATLPLPGNTAELALYVVSGSVKIDAQDIPSHEMAVIDTSRPTAVSATDDTHLVIIGGAPLGKRTVWWNLVSSRRELIEKAKQDWQEGRFERVPGETEFIPLPTQKVRHD